MVERAKITYWQDIKQEWYHQFLSDDLDVKSLTNKINDMFLSITEDFQPLHH